MNPFTLAKGLVIGLGISAMLAAPIANAQNAVEEKIREPAQWCHGVWRGTIGNQEVVLMLPGPSAPTIGTYPGKYYYLRYLTDIELRPKGDSCEIWMEHKENVLNATFTFKASSQDTLEGQWSDRDGERSLPIHLKRLAAANKHNEHIHRSDPNVWQGAYAYDQPKIRAQKLTVTEARIDKHRYRVLSAFSGAIKGIEFPEADGKVSLLNMRARQWREDQIVRFVDECRNEKKPEATATMSVELWKGSLVVIRERYSYWCGGGMRPDMSSTSSTFDLRAGRYVDTQTWVRRRGEHEYDEELKTMVLSRFKQLSNRDGDDQCFVYVAEMGFRPSRLGNNGVVFTPFLMDESTGCGDGVELSFDQLRPFLTSEGKAAAQSLRK